MKKPVKLTAAAAAVLVLASAWYWRYDGINRYYQDYAGLGYVRAVSLERRCALETTTSIPVSGPRAIQ